MKEVIYLLIVGYSLAVPHHHAHDETLSCYSCTAKQHYPMYESHEEDRSCLDPRKHDVPLIDCTNTLCMKLTIRTISQGYVLFRGCGFDNLTLDLDPGCVTLTESMAALPEEEEQDDNTTLTTTTTTTTTSKPKSKDEIERYACFCHKNRCNNEPGLVVERREKPERLINISSLISNSAYSFPLMKEEKINFLILLCSVVVGSTFMNS